MGGGRLAENSLPSKSKMLGNGIGTVGSGYSLMRASISVFLTECYSRFQITENGIGRACGTYGGEERCIQDLGGEK